MNKFEMFGTLFAAVAMLIGMVVFSVKVTWGLGILAYIVIGLCIIALAAYTIKEIFDAFKDGVAWWD